MSGAIWFRHCWPEFEAVPGDGRDYLDEEPECPFDVEGEEVLEVAESLECVNAFGAAARRRSGSVLAGSASQAALM